jgi:hypothetical protein
MISSPPPPPARPLPGPRPAPRRRPVAGVIPGLPGGRPRPGRPSRSPPGGPLPAIASIVLAGPRAGGFLPVVDPGPSRPAWTGSGRAAPLTDGARGSAPAAPCRPGPGAAIDPDVRSGVAGPRPASHSYHQRTTPSFTEPTP